MREPSLVGLCPGRGAGAGAGGVGFLELLLMVTSKTATCEKVPAGAEVVWCFASRQSDPVQRQGLAVEAMGAVGVAGAAVCGSACSSYLSLLK